MRKRLVKFTPLLAIAMAFPSLASPATADTGAAALEVSIHNDHVDGIECTYVLAGSHVTYTVLVGNVGAEAAVGVPVAVTLPAYMSQVMWTATYAGGAQGPTMGTAGPDVVVHLPAASSATFSVATFIPPRATGEALVSATATLGSEVVTATDGDTILASVLVSDSWRGHAPRVRVKDPASGAVLAEFLAFERNFRGGVQAAMGDLDGDGRPEIITVPGPGRVGEVRVFRIDVDADGSPVPVADPGFTLRAFGAHYRDGLVVAAGDFDGDGLSDIAVARATGKGKVHVYVTRPGQMERYRSFVPRRDGRLVGITLAAGDFGTRGRNGNDPAVPDGTFELVVAGETGSAGVVQVRDVSLARAPVIRTIRIPRLARGGFHVSVARVSRDSIPDLIITRHDGGRARIDVHDGLLGEHARGRLASFTAGQPYAGRPVFGAGVDKDGDGRADHLHVAWSGRREAAKSSHPVRDRQDGSLVIGSGTAGVRAAHGQFSMAMGPPPSLVTTPSGLQYRDVVVGAGASASTVGADLTINYATWLLNGTQIDASNGFRFPSGSGQVIAGLDEGVASMRVGGRRQLIIPPGLAYGSAGRGTVVPPNATLVFDVELVSVS